MGTIFIGKSIITYTLTDELEKQQSKLNVRKEGEREDKLTPSTSDLND